MKKMLSLVTLAMLSLSIIFLMVNVKIVSSQPQKLADGNESFCIAVDSAHVYFTEYGTEFGYIGNVKKVSMDGGAVETGEWRKQSLEDNH